MNVLKRGIFRIYQKVLHLSMYFLPFKEPLLFEGENSVEEMCKHLRTKNIKKLFIVTDENIVGFDFFKDTLKILSDNEISAEIFSGVKPNPSIQLIEVAYQKYIEDKYDGLFAIGGGSAIDLAKGIGIRFTHPNKTLQSRKGILKVLKKQPLLIAMPTTAGTGSEATVACVVTDEETNEKYAINDPVLIPKIACLNPKTCLKLPQAITATTGIDALTHAVEAYIGGSNTKKTKRMAKEAIQGINDNLLNSYQNGNDLQVRLNMLKASYQAGVAFTRAYVGNVHALAHQLGGMYHVPHGLANAVLMPYVLKYYQEKAYKKLSELYLVINDKANPKEEKENSIQFISWIRLMNKEMNIPERFDLDASEDDLLKMSQRAYKEANPLYPVPMIFDVDDFLKIYKQAIQKAN
jgi:alcohol dehydrogenase class IV